MICFGFELNDNQGFMQNKTEIFIKGGGTK